MKNYSRWISAFPLQNSVFQFSAGRKCVLGAVLGVSLCSTGVAAENETHATLSSWKFKNFTIVRGLATKRDLTDASPGYAGVNVSADILDDSSDTVAHILVKKVNCPADFLRDNEQCVKADVDYYLPAASVSKGARTINQGLVTGFLAVPFKYHFSDHAVTSGTTLGAYIGYEKGWDWAGSLALVLGGGLALIPTSTATTNFTPGSSQSASTTTTTTADSTLTGMSFATGFIGRIGDSNAQFGVLVGTDLTNKSHNYKYNGKPWLSFSFGYSFSGSK